MNSPLTQTIGFFLVLAAIAFPQFHYAQSSSGSEPTILGKWKVDWILFINNGERTEGEPPLSETLWNFNKDGNYMVEGMMAISGTYEWKEDRILINTMGMEMEYFIIEHTDDKMVLQSVIAESETLSMKTETRLVR